MKHKRFWAGLAAAACLAASLSGCGWLRPLQALLSAARSGIAPASPASSAAAAALPDTASAPAQAASAAPDADSAFAQLRQSILAGEASVTLAGVSVDVFDAAYQRILLDPELFGISGCQYTYGDSGVTVSWKWDSGDYADQLQAARAAADAVCAGISAQAGDYDKAKYVHDWLCQNVTYQENGDRTDQNIYGALVLHRAVCGGYASTFVYLLQRLGVAASYIAGTDDTGGAHAWNSVVLGGETYYVDVTWDDQTAADPGFIDYSWFCLTSAEMRADHIPGDGYAMPDTSATACNYFVHSGYVLDSWDEARCTEILAQQTSGCRMLRCADDACYQQTLQALVEDGRLFDVLEAAGSPTDNLRYITHDGLRVLIVFG